MRAVANHSYVRYRFVAKHWEDAALTAFFAAERAALAAVGGFPEVVGRVLAARDLLRRLDDVLACRGRDLGTRLDRARRRQLQVGFAEILRGAMAEAERQCAIAEGESIVLNGRSPAEIRGEELALLTCLQRRYGMTDPAGPERPLRRWLRALVLRPFRIVTGRDHALLVALAALQQARLDAVEVGALHSQLRLLRLLAENDHR